MLGYLGRIRALNLLKLRRGIEVPGLFGRGDFVYCYKEKLAELLGISIHTMFDEHGLPVMSRGRTIKVRWRDKLRPELAGGARFCFECVVRDESEFHVPIWQRRHQLEGVYVCPEHGGYLKTIPYVYCPSRVSSDFREIYCITREISASEVERFTVQQYGRVAETVVSVLGGGFFCHVILRKFAVVIFERAKEMGLVPWAGGRPNYYLSDLAASTFPRQWLMDVFPSWSKKISGKYYDDIDGFMDSSSRRRYVKYPLALVLMFSSDELESTVFPTLERMKLDFIRSCSESEIDGYIRWYIKEIVGERAGEP